MGLGRDWPGLCAQQSGYRVSFLPGKPAGLLHLGDCLDQIRPEAPGNRDLGFGAHAADGAAVPIQPKDVGWGSGPPCERHIVAAKSEQIPTRFHLAVRGSASLQNLSKSPFQDGIPIQRQALLVRSPGFECLFWS